MGWGRGSTSGKHIWSPQALVWWSAGGERGPRTLDSSQCPHLRCSPWGMRMGNPRLCPPGQAGSGGWGRPGDSGGGRNAAVGTELSSRTNPPPSTQGCYGWPLAPAPSRWPPRARWLAVIQRSPHQAALPGPRIPSRAAGAAARAPDLGWEQQPAGAAEARALPYPPPSGLRDGFSPVPLPLLTEKRKLCVFRARPPSNMPGGGDTVLAQTQMPQ